MVGTDLARVLATTRERLRGHPDADVILPTLAETLAWAVEEWSVVIGDPFPHGIGAPVWAVTAEGEPAVLKLDAPGPRCSAQIATMRAADGRGYARVLASDRHRGALLLERLGPDLWDSDAGPAEQLAHLAAALEQAWTVPVGIAPAPEPGADKASELARIIEEFRRPEDDARWGAAFNAAYDTALHLSRTRDPVRDVLCHGDPHPGNALSAPGGYRFVDPDGFRCERDYDVAVGLRDFSTEILDEPHDANAREFLDRLVVDQARATGADADRVWAWAFVERVTTGLYLRWFDEGEQAATFLDSAVRLIR